jgi:hypothetical protein
VQSKLLKIGEMFFRRKRELDAAKLALSRAEAAFVTADSNFRSAFGLSFVEQLPAIKVVDLLLQEQEREWSG